jgi:hypothetical protein
MKNPTCAEVLDTIGSALQSFDLDVRRQSNRLDVSGELGPIKLSPRRGGHGLGFRAMQDWIRPDRLVVRQATGQAATFRLRKDGTFNLDGVMNAIMTRRPLLSRK